MYMYIYIYVYVYFHDVPSPPLMTWVAGPAAPEELLIPLTNLSEEHVVDAIRTERAGHGRANRRPGNDRGPAPPKGLCKKTRLEV